MCRTSGRNKIIHPELVAPGLIQVMRGGMGSGNEGGVGNTFLWVLELPPALTGCVTLRKPVNLSWLLFLCLQHNEYTGLIHSIKN